MEDLRRFDIKIFVEKNSGLTARDFVPIFQRWIQEHTIPGTLIDVADYAHMHNGPGVILIGHETNISIDSVGGQMGLLYHIKQPAPGPFQERLKAAIQAAQDACTQLEKEPELKGRLTFRDDGFLLIANDRLLAPNEEPILAELEAALREATAGLYDGDPVFLRPSSNSDSRARAAIEVTTQPQCSSPGVRPAPSPVERPSK